MSEIKTLNGYEIADVKARSDLAALTEEHVSISNDRHDLNYAVFGESGQENFKLTPGNIDASGEVETTILDETYVYTDYLPIPENAVTIKNNFRTGGGSWALYDADKSFISGGKTNYTIAPNGAAYIRFTDYSADKDHTGRYFTIYVANSIESRLNMAEVKTAPITRYGKVCDTNEYTAGGFLHNNGTIQTNGYGAYSYSKHIPVNKGDTLMIPFTGDQLNTQLGGYFRDGVWLGSLGSATPSDGYYRVALTEVLDYDSVIVNIWHETPHASDFSVYVNEISDSVGYLFNGTAKSILDVSTANSWNGKTWVALGDSWTEGAYVDSCGRYTDYVSGALGLHCINLGVGGSGVEMFAEQTNKPLTNDIAASADLITIWGSINNMAAGGISCGTIVDEPNKTGTLMARWKYTIEKVLALNPMAKIVIIGCPISLHANWSGYDAYNAAGDTIESSVEMIGKLARHYGLPFIDMYQLSGFNAYNFGKIADNNFGYDKVHASRKGVIRVSDVLIGELLKMQPYVG